MLSVGIPSFVFAVSKVELVSGGKFQSRVVAVLLVEGAAAEDAHGLVLAVQQVAYLQREVDPVVEERLLNQAAYLHEGVVDAVGGVVAAGLAMESPPIRQLWGRRKRLLQMMLSNGRPSFCLPPSMAFASKSCWQYSLSFLFVFLCFACKSNKKDNVGFKYDGKRQGKCRSFSVMFRHVKIHAENMRYLCIAIRKYELKLKQEQWKLQKELKCARM